MREIRFAWVCRNIKFNEIHRIELTDEMLLNGSYPSWITYDNCEIIAKILPIGLKDKNGEEIWEGDRLYNGKGHYRTVNFIIGKGAWFAGTLRLTRTLAYQLEVIGNIYDNPELLEGAK